MRTEKSTRLPFPNPDVIGDVDFVLDGMQRLSALYGAFHDRPGIAPSDDMFDVVFELKDRKFLHSSEATETSISLRSLFTPKKILAVQAKLANMPDGEDLIERSMDLLRAFQEYLLPVIRIGKRATDEVVEIFERINTAGTRLSAVDFIRAMTWSKEFDLSKRLNELADIDALAPYDIDPDTLAKSIALELNVIPKGSEMLALRGKEPSDLNNAALAVQKALESAGRYLSQELDILSYDYVPYEGQFLVLVSVATAFDGVVPKWFAPWYWTVGFSEAMQGRPDRTNAKLALDARQGKQLKNEHFGLTVDVLKTRTVIKGAAISMSIVAAIARNNLRSVLSGQDLPLEDFMTGFDSNSLAGVFSKKELAMDLDPPPRGNKVLANIVLLGNKERRPHPGSAKIRERIVELAVLPKGQDALDSQCISRDCVEAIRTVNVGLFLECRAHALLKRALELSK